MKLERPEQRFDELYSIYEESFPDSERRTYEDQKKTVEREGCCIRAIEEDGKIVTFLEYWDLESCIFMEYLASTKAWRNKGHGRQLLEACLREAKEKGKPAFLEIEPPTEEDPMTIRRAGFYRRLGFCLDHFPYQQPPLKSGDEWKDLMVMSYGTEIEEEKFRAYQKEIYKTVYGQEE